MKIGIFINENSRGLQRDAEVLEEAVGEIGHDAIRVPLKLTGKHNADFDIYEPENGYPNDVDLGIWVEVFPPQLPRTIPIKVLIPYPEWTTMAMMSQVKQFDKVLTKLPDATQIMRGYHPDVSEVGFYSIAPKIRAERHREFLMLAGESPLKEAETVLRLWEAHPEWPILRAFVPERLAMRYKADNILAKTASYDCETRDLVARSEFHICPSRAEGWGHYFFEAIGAGGVVVYNDLPSYKCIFPSNLGFPVSVVSDGKLGFTPAFRLNVSSFENAVNAALCLTPSETALISSQCVDHHERMKRAFLGTLSRLLDAF